MLRFIIGRMTRIRGRVVAMETVETMTDETRPALGRLHPRPLHQRRIVPHVLPVAAGQNRPPVSQLVPFEADNWLFHSVIVPRESFYCPVRGRARVPACLWGFW